MAGKSSNTGDSRRTEDLIELGGWKLEKPLGAGAFGQVHLATRQRVNGSTQTAAIKLVSPFGENFSARAEALMHEFEMLKRISSPYVAPVIDSGREQATFDGKPIQLLWIAVEYIPGQNLQDEIDTQGILSKSEWLDLAHDLLAATAAAHEAGVINSDIKPDNIMRSARRAVLIDFGVATVYDSVEFKGSGSWQPKGVAPERINPAGTGEDLRMYESDVFSVGVALVYSATGLYPWDLPPRPQVKDPREALALQMRRHFNEITTKPPRLGGMDPDQQAFVTNLLNPDPSKRPSASEALEIIRDMLADGNPRKDNELSFDRVRTVPQGYREKKPSKKANIEPKTPVKTEKGQDTATSPKRSGSRFVPHTVVINRGPARSRSENKVPSASRLLLTLLLVLVPIIGPATRFYFLERENRGDYPSRIERLISAAFYSYYTLGIGGFLACRRWSKASGSRRLKILGWLQLLWIPISIGPVWLAQVMPNLGAALSLPVFAIYVLGPIFQSVWAPDWSSTNKNNAVSPASTGEVDPGTSKQDA